MYLNQNHNTYMISKVKVGNTDGEGEKGQGSSKNRDEIWESATWYILINILLFADFPPFYFLCFYVEIGEGWKHYIPLSIILCFVSDSGQTHLSEKM